MKKKIIRLNLLLLVMAVTVSAAFAAKARYSSSIPKMEDKKNVTYFTRDDFQKQYKDNIRFVSRTDDRVDFTVYAYNENTKVWFVVGTARIRYYDDTCFLDEEVSRLKLSKYNYFAIETDNKKKYSYSYDVRHNDIYITVRDK